MKIVTQKQRYIINDSGTRTARTEHVHAQDSFYGNRRYNGEPSAKRELKKGSSLTALLSAAERGRGYPMKVRGVYIRKEVVYIELREPARTAVMTRKTYNKIKDYIDREQGHTVSDTPAACHR